MPSATDLSGPELVAREYEDETRLVARRRAWREFLQGPSVEDWAFDAVAEVEPGRVLDVGCGTGELGKRIATGAGASVTAVDRSSRMTRLAGERGLRALVADARALPFRDEAFDVVIANAVLYHLRRLDRALSEMGRVLATGGRFVATTFATDRFAELWELIGISPPPLPFDTENGDEILRRHFERVEVRLGRHALEFPDADEVRAYVASMIAMADLADRVPPSTGPFRTTRGFGVFVASGPTDR